MKDNNKKRLEELDSSSSISSDKKLCIYDNIFSVTFREPLDMSVDLGRTVYVMAPSPGAAVAAGKRLLRIFKPQADVGGEPVRVVLSNLNETFLFSSKEWLSDLKPRFTINDLFYFGTESKRL